MYHLGVVHIPMILMGIINKDYYLQLIRNKKKLFNHSILLDLTNRLLPSLSVLDFKFKIPRTANELVKKVRFEKYFAGIWLKFSIFSDSTLGKNQKQLFSKL